MHTIPKSFLGSTRRNICPTMSPPGPRVVGIKRLRTKPHAANPGRAAFLPERNRLLRVPLLNWHIIIFMSANIRIAPISLKHYNNVISFNFLFLNLILHWDLMYPIFTSYDFFLIPFYSALFLIFFGAHCQYWGCDLYNDVHDGCI